MKNPHVKSFRELIVYQRQRELSRAVFLATKSFPAEEKYSLTDQVRRSTRSIGAQIAESWGKRRYEKHFISKLTDALSETYETEHWIETAVEDSLIDKEASKPLLSLTGEITRMLESMIKKSDSFTTTPRVSATRSASDTPGAARLRAPLD